MADKEPETFETFSFESPPIRGYPELRWAGKKPYTSTQYYPAQRRESYGDSVSGWSNQIFWGDNLQVMSHLLRDYRQQVDMVYIDPPFDSNADYKRTIKLKGKSASSDGSAFEEKQYTDIWGGDGYLQFMYERLTLIRELLSGSGTLMVHVDQKKHHHLRQICEEIFGPGWFQNEIVWFYENKLGTGGDILDSFHDTILVFSKTKKWMKNPIRVPVKVKKGQPVTQKIDGERVWLRDDDGNRLYKESEDTRRLGDVWPIPIINPVANERLGYPTQKPERLLAFAMQAASSPGDLVFDCFMGSGTTQAVAMKMGRRFIGADINLGSIETTIKRLNSIREEQKADQSDLFGDLEVELPEQQYLGFEVHNVNNYDIFRNPAEANDLIKEAMELQPLPTSSVFDGQRDQHLVKIMPVNRIATRADLNEVINGMDFKAYERRQAEAPSKIVDRIMLVCMGHEPDIGPELVKAAKPFNIEVEVVDLIRDKANLHFKRQSDAKLVIKDGHLEIAGFYPLNLLQKLSMDTDAVEDWRQLVETIKVDWNYDGAVLSPELIDAPDKNELVNGRYPIPDDASTIRVKITDLLSESWEGEIDHG
ncbi:site-specific DNA-methyltransferase [Henriciella sp. AS95]|uniref:site-specific DNA-methyltransferase n=1 Tax=Henriciella sp. AS95 TaxID=3135782 RepID=UPI00317C710D